MTGTRRPILALALAALAAGGCDESITEVVLLVTSDLRPFLDIDSISFNAQPGIGSPQPFGACQIPSPIGAFPISMGFVSGGSTGVFSVTVQLTKNQGQQQVVSRTITGIRFMSEQLRMLTVPLHAACACMGTSCPNPGTIAECDAIDSPATVPFDPLVAPPTSPWNSNRCQTFFGGGGGVF